jgi:diguanylate cyclase (GGDEF)-like protein
MPQTKTRWGLFLFLISFVFIGAAVFVSIKYPFFPNTGFYLKIFPGVGLTFSIVSLFIGHLSFPRVQNLKVYLFAYLSGLSGIGYFLFFLPPFISPLPVTPESFPLFLYAMASINLLSIPLVPSHVKYHTARHIVIALLTIQCVVMLVFRFSTVKFFSDIDIVYHNFFDPSCITCAGALIFVIVLSIWRVRHDFYLGGILAGTGLIYAASWISHVYFVYQNAEPLLFAAAPLYSNFGIIVHWFAHMEHRISFDPLLHIYNRDYCSRIISEQSTLDLSPPLSVAMIDIDHFKNVNDTYGHQAGDMILHSVAQTIYKEAQPGGVACRYGGEEIVVFFPQKNIVQTVPVVENIRKAIEKTKTRTAKKNISVSVSCGVSCKEESGQTIMDVIQAADKALYKAKEGGRNQVKSGKTVSMTAGKK